MGKINRKYVFIIILSLVLLLTAYAQDIMDMTKAEFDSIPYIESPYRMIISKARCDFPQKHEWRGLVTGTGKGALRIGTIVEVLKEYNEYFFVKTSRGGFGWVKKDCLKKPSNPNRRFTLEFTLGDSLGRGILGSSVYVSSDAEGNIYILEVTVNWEYRLHKYDPRGNFIQFISIPLQPKKGREIEHTYWSIRETAFMKSTETGAIFIVTKDGASKFSQNGEKLLEINQNLNYPTVLDISENGNIYVLEYCKIGKHANERQDIRIKIYSRQGDFIDSLIVDDLQNATDLKVRNKKIYVVGERISPLERFSLTRTGKSAFEKKMGNYTLDLIEYGLNNYSKNVIRVYAFNKRLIREISVKSMFHRVEDLVPYEAEFFTKYGIGDIFIIRWRNIAVDRLGNIYLAVGVIGEDCSASHIIEYDSLGYFKKKLPYSRERCAYGGSYRSLFRPPGQADIEMYVDNSVLFASGGWIYRIKDDSIFKAVKHTPGKEYFIDPTAIAIDREDNILVSDSKLNELKKFNPNGSLLWSIGSLGKGEGEFRTLGDLCVDKLGNVYAADNANGRVQKFDKYGNFILSFELPKLHRAVSGAVFDVYIDDNGNVNTLAGQTVQVFTPNGDFIEESKFHPSIPRVDIYGQMIGASKTFDRYGNIWIFVVPRRRKPVPFKIYVFNGSGEILDAYTAGNFDKPPRIISDIIFDNAGNLWIADPGTYQVKKYSLK